MNVGKIRIGLSGWSYEEWDGVFYPADLASRHRLAHVAKTFSTVEVNGTFYSLTTPAAVRSWKNEAPSPFVFAIKGSRYITHTRRLRDAKVPLANFLASGLLDLGGQLGPILWQLPPNLEFNRVELTSFLDLLPRDSTTAVRMARAHDDKVDDVSYGDRANHRIRHVIEFRHPSFLNAEAIALARRFGCAVACSHSSEWPTVADVTAGFMYIRLHGPGEIYQSGYDEHRLKRWAERISTWRSGGEVDDMQTYSKAKPPARKERDVYVYFDNTAAGHAPKDAMRLKELLSV